MHSVCGDLWRSVEIYGYYMRNLYDMTLHAIDDTMLSMIFTFQTQHYITVYVYMSIRHLSDIVSSVPFNWPFRKGFALHPRPQHFHSPKQHFHSSLSLAMTHQTLLSWWTLRRRSPSRASHVGAVWSEVFQGIVTRSDAVDVHLPRTEARRGHGSPGAPDVSSTASAGTSYQGP